MLHCKQFTSPFKKVLVSQKLRFKTIKMKTLYFHRHYFMPLYVNYSIFSAKSVKLHQICSKLINHSVRAAEMVTYISAQLVPLAWCCLPVPGKKILGIARFCPCPVFKCPSLPVPDKNARYPSLFRSLTGIKIPDLFCKRQRVLETFNCFKRIFYENRMTAKTTRLHWY